MHTVQSHSRSVLCLDVANDFVVTGSEDQTVLVWDRRSSQDYKRIDDVRARAREETHSISSFAYRFHRLPCVCDTRRAFFESVPATGECIPTAKTKILLKQR